MERVANIAQQSPALVALNLHTLKYLIQGFRQGKMFQTEVTSAIDNVIKQAEDAAKKAPPQFNKDEAMANLKKMELDSGNQIAIERMNRDTQIRIEQIQSTERMEMTRVQSQAQTAALKAQFEQFKLQVEAGQATAELQLSYQQLSADIGKTREELALKHDALFVEMQKISGEDQAKQFKLLIDKQSADFDAQLRQQQLALDEQKVMLDEREKYLTEQRLQSEHELENIRTKVEMVTMLKEATSAEAPKLPPVHITVESPTPTKKKKKIKIERDEFGNPVSFETSDVEDPIVK